MTPAGGLSSAAVAIDRGLIVSGAYADRNVGARPQFQVDVLADADDHHGVVTVSGRRPYLTDTRFYLRHGFELAERTDTGYDLVYVRRRPDAPTPRFADSARRGTVPRGPSASRPGGRRASP